MRIIVYTGKGGVGKTSIAAATAVRAAQCHFLSLASRRLCSFRVVPVSAAGSLQRRPD